MGIAAMHGNKPSLEGRLLSRTYGQGAAATQALRDVSLSLWPGQMTVLMGPSGSGKSTLLAVLSGLLRPDSGQVLALGKDLEQMGERGREEFRRCHCGFIFQGFNLFPALTARQHVEIVLRWTGRSGIWEARRRTEQILGALGLGSKAGLRPGQLSGGEKQRVAIAQALAKAPALCFADEPTSALDWAHGEQIVEMLRAEAVERGATLLVVSHDRRVVAYGDQVLCIADGRLSQSQTTRDTILGEVS
jgi:putative ABC transport system ATP-binding protein